MELERKGYYESDLKDRAIIPVKYKKSPVKYSVRCEGLMYGVSGFAEAMRNIVYYLDKNKVNVTAHPLDNKDADNVDILSTKKGEKIHELSEIGYDTDLPKVKIVMTIPEGVKRIPGYYMIAYIMFETQEFPKKYIKHLNNNADEIWTPSQFNVDNIKKAGWKKPIFKMPLGVDTKRFDPQKVKSFHFTESPIGLFENKFVFLSIMGWSERKGVSILLEAYFKEFSSKYDDTVLYIKGGWYDEKKAWDEVKKAIKKSKKKIEDLPLIYLDFRIYSDQDHPRLYKSANAFVLPTLGEGWGLNFTEAMSMRLYVIGTYSTSQVDFINKDNSYPVKVKAYRKEPRCDWITPDYKGAKFAIPDILDLRKKMRSIYSKTLADIDIRYTARLDMEKKWTWDHAAKNWIARLREIEL